MSIEDTYDAFPIHNLQAGPNLYERGEDIFKKGFPESKYYDEALMILQE